jgi:hypothetical protein
VIRIIVLICYALFAGYCDNHTKKITMDKKQVIQKTRVLKLLSSVLL